jgi:hypothetical protein
MKHFTFIIKAVDSIDRGALVIPSQKEKVPWVLYLISQKEAYCFEGIFASVDIIAQKEIIAFRRKFAVIEKSQ